MRLRTIIHRGLISLLLAPSFAMAQNVSVIENTNNCNFNTGRLNAACIPEFIGHLVQIAFALLGIFFLLNVMYAGYQLALGSIQGDKSKGKDRITWSVIGFIAASCSYLILDLVLSLI